MKNKWKFNPLLRMFVFLSALILLVIITGIGLFYYVFSIPEPEGLSLADWPNRFTGNFSLWMENDNGTLRSGWMNMTFGSKLLMNQDRKFSRIISRKITPQVILHLN